MSYLQRPTIEQLRQSVLDLADAVRDNGTGDKTFQSYLRFFSNFHRLSAANTLLVMQQCPTATFTKGFKGWKTLGRAVRRGEKGLWIYAPSSKKRCVEIDAVTGEETWREWTGYRAVPVFDVSQTVGPPWNPPNYTLDLGEGVQPVHDALIHYAQSLGVAVQTGAIFGSVNGFYAPSDRRITLNDALPIGIAARTLTHEIVHHLLLQSHEARKTPRGFQELETEAVAAVVWMRLGYEQVAVNSGAYCSSWGGTQSPALILLSMNRIAKTASMVFDGLLAHMPQAITPLQEQAEDAAAMEVGDERENH